MRKVKPQPNFHVKIDPQLRDRLKAVCKKLEVPVRWNGTTRSAFMTEIFRLAAEHIATLAEADQDILKGTQCLPGARQVDSAGASIVALAPLASFGVYASLKRGEVPSDEQQAALDVDTAFFEPGMPVEVRGSLFGTCQEWVGLHGEVVRVPRGGGMLRVNLKDVGVVEVHPYDLVPNRPEVKP